MPPGRRTDFTWEAGKHDLVFDSQFDGVCGAHERSAGRHLPVLLEWPASVVG